MRRMFTQIVGAIAAMTAFAGPACAMKPELVNAPAPISRDAEMNAYILLDRTGSMSSIWDEALNSVNVYAASLGTQEEDEIGDVDASVTLASLFQLVSLLPQLCLRLACRFLLRMPPCTRGEG